MMKKSGSGIITTLLLFVLVTLANVVSAQRGAAQPGMPATGGGVFDITKYGAVADEKTDISQALTKAFGEACQSRAPATIVIPPGTYLCGQTNLKAPCTAPSITFQVLGTIKAPSDIAGDTWFLFDNINNLNIVGNGVFDGLGPSCYKTKKSVAVNLRFNYVTNAMIQGITSKDSKQFHFIVIGGKNLTFDQLTITAAKDSPNTDGIHLGRAAQVNIINTNIGTGDDCISVGDGVSDLTVQNVTCGPGHGIAVGSLGRYANEEPVRGIHVKNCTLTNTCNGLRIKSWPDMEAGSATDISFEDIILNNVSFPIIIDQAYCPWNTCKHTGVPSKVKISDVTYNNIQGTSATPQIVQMNCSAAIPCENVKLSNINIQSPTGPPVSACANVKPIITGTIPPVLVTLANVVSAQRGAAQPGMVPATGGGVFDITKYGAVADEKTDISQNLRFNYVMNAMIQGITSLDSKQFHIIVIGGKNLTFDQLTITAAKDSPNTDGIHLGRASQVNILNTNIGTGDDCISVGDGVSDLIVQNVTCGPGHGIAVGSLGRYANEEPVRGIHVKNCTLTNTCNGLRIKSWPDMEPGSATDISFEDIILNNVSFPIIIDQVYCPWNTCKKTGVPSKVKISDVTYNNIQGTSATPQIVQMNCSAAIPCENIKLSNINIQSPTGPPVSACANVKPIVTGTIPPGCA
ncbi:G9 [Linum grandiflorum]